MWLLGCLSIGIVLMALKGIINRKKEFLILIIAALFPLFLPSIGSYTAEPSHTFRRAPLPVPQIIESIIHIYSRKWDIVK